MKKITLIGPTGSTGRLVARQLRDAAVPFRLAGRNLAKVQEVAAGLTSAGTAEVECIQVDVTSQEQVLQAVSGTSTLINCAGPFTDLGLLVLKTCAEQGVDYLDTTGEQDFIRKAVDNFSSVARANSCALVPACAFEYALGDAAAALLSEALDGLDEFEVTYVFDGISTSRGTRKSVLRALASPAYQLIDGKLTEVKPGHVEPFRKNLSRFTFPGGEVCLVPLHTKVRCVKTYLASPTPAPILSAMTQIGPMVARSPLRSLLDKLIDMTGSELTTPEKTTFTMFCAGSKGTQTATLELSGADPYGLTAAIAAAIAQVLHERTEKDPVGTASASMIKGALFIKEITEAHKTLWSLA